MTDLNIEIGAQLVLQLCEELPTPKYKLPKNVHRLWDSAIGLKDPIGAAVLVFLPGKGELMKFEEKLWELHRHRCRKREDFCVVQIHGQADNESQKSAFRPVKGGVTKVVLATNAAETSITIPDVIYVVDFCLTKVN